MAVGEIDLFNCRAKFFVLGQCVANGFLDLRTQALCKVLLGDADAQTLQWLVERGGEFLRWPVDAGRVFLIQARHGI